MTELSPRKASLLMDRIAGQSAAKRELQNALASPLHAYLFVGRDGARKTEIALAFAASILCDSNGCGQCKSCRMSATKAHPDLFHIRPIGPILGLGEAREATRLAIRSPQESTRQVIIIEGLHTSVLAVPALLKTVEEPPDSTVFVLMTDRLGTAMSTIASRCCVINFDAEVRLSSVNQNDIELRDSPSVVWRDSIDRLDGTGLAAMAIVDDLLAAVDSATAPLKKAHAKQSAATSAKSATKGSKRTDEGTESRKDREERQRREQRRARTEELKRGLTIMASSCVQKTLHGSAGLDTAKSPLQISSDGVRAERCVALIDDVARALARNPNEALLLQVLMIELASLTVSPNME